VIIKTPYTRFSSHVEKASNEAEFIEISKHLLRKTKVLVVQEYIRSDINGKNVCGTLLQCRGIQLNIWRSNTYTKKMNRGKNEKNYNNSIILFPFNLNSFHFPPYKQMLFPLSVEPVGGNCLSVQVLTPIIVIR
jgi:hypothetical protein